jgi:hypothetical protein
MSPPATVNPSRRPCDDGPAVRGAPGMSRAGLCVGLPGACGLCVGLPGACGLCVGLPEGGPWQSGGYQGCTRTGALRLGVRSSSQRMKTGVPWPFIP